MNWLNVNKRLIALIALAVVIFGFLLIGKAPDNNAFDRSKFPQERQGLVGPCQEYWLGTMLGGKDLANYVCHAMFRSVTVAIVVSLTTLSIGVLIGGLWALSHQAPRRSFLAIVVLTALGPTPLLMMMAVISVFESPGSWIAMVLAMCSVAWAPIALRMRNEVLGELDAQYVQNARRQGVGDLRLLWEEILPRLSPATDALLILSGISAVTGEATISYLAGARIKEPSLGALLGQVPSVFQESPSAGIRLLVVAAVTMMSTIFALRLWGAWRDDVRLSCAMSPRCENHTNIKIGQDGFIVNAYMKRLGIPVVRGVFIPDLPGQLLVLSGASGSAKTTAACAMAGQLDPDLLGNCRAVGTARGKRVVYQPQGLQEAFAEGVGLDQYFYAAGLSDRDAITLLNRVGVKGRHDSGAWKTGKELSGGEAQRIAAGLLIESAIRQPVSTRPNVLIFDESVSALDDENADRIGSMLRGLLRSNPEMAVIVINHRAGWTRKWADFVVVLDNGQELWSGTPQGLFGNEEPKDACDNIKEYLHAVRLLETPGESIRHRREEALRVEGLSARYSDASIVQDVNFSVHHGEAVVVTGESGCGKTTVLKSIDGGDSSLKVEGSVLILGDEVKSASPGSIRYAAQNPVESLNPDVPVKKTLHRTVRRERLARGRKSEQKLVEEACRKSAFPLQALTKKPAELSGGTRIRAGLARTFVGSPRILLLDEPTAGLDPEIAVVVLDQLRQFLREGGAVVAVMHDVDHIRYLGAKTVSISRR